MNITEIKKGVTQLSENELAEFVEWLDEFQESLWDKQIEEDLKAGKLDHLIEQAEKSLQ